MLSSQKMKQIIIIMLFTSIASTLTHLMPSFSNILIVGSSFASTTTRSGSSISTFIESHLEDIHRGWLSGIRGWGAVINCRVKK